jgi:fructosamine-3-kinase
METAWSRGRCVDDAVKQLLRLEIRARANRSHRVLVLPMLSQRAWMDAKRRDAIGLTAAPLHSAREAKRLGLKSPFDTASLPQGS